MSRRRTNRDTTEQALNHHELHDEQLAQGITTTLAGDQPCPGPCNRDYRTAEDLAATETALAELEQRDPNPEILNHGKTFHAGAPTWCIDIPVINARGEIAQEVSHRGCTERITHDLAALPELAHNLGPGPLNTPRDITGRRASGGTSAPSPSPSWDELDALIRWALHLEDDLRARLHHPTAHGRIEPVYVTWRTWHPPLTRPARWAIRTSHTIELPRTLHDATRFLNAYSKPLLAGPDAETIGRAITSWKRRLTHDTGTDRLIHRLPGTCLVCDRKGLQRVDGDDLVKCRRCGACWDWGQYQLLAKAYADDVRRRA